MRFDNRFKVMGLLLIGAIAFLAAPGYGRQFITLGTANPGGTWYHVGSGICKVLNQLNPGWKMTPEATGGGTENLRRVARGEIEVGLTHVSDIFRDVKKQKVSPKDFRLIMGAHTSIAHFVVLKKSPYTRLEQIMKKGVKMGVGEPGSAIQGIAKIYLSLYNLTFDDIKAAPLNQSEQVNAIKDGVIDVALLGSGLPVPSAMDLATTKGIRIIEIPDADIAKLRARSPVWIKYVIPAGVYPGVDKPVQTFGIPAYLIAKKDLSDEIAYMITKGILENNQEIAKVHRAGMEYNAKNAFRFVAPLLKIGCQFHPGAVKYYKEKGLWRY